MKNDLTARLFGIWGVELRMFCIYDVLLIIFRVFDSFSLINEIGYIIVVSVVSAEQMIVWFIACRKSEKDLDDD